MTQYLLDTQPGLWQVLASTMGADTTRYVHGPTGIQQQQNPDNAWLYPMQDALGSIRSVADEDMAVLESRQYEPNGEPWGVTGAQQTDFGFTGEPVDDNGLVYLRARHYNPALGVFPSLDPLEGEMNQAMSLNGYGWVEGNVANRIDPSGLIFWDSPQGLGGQQRRADPDRYNSRTPAHGAIEVWLEQTNGFWRTQLEFPGARFGRAGGSMKLDAVVFERLASLGSSPVDFLDESVTAHVFEIEPIARRGSSARCPIEVDWEALVNGYAELQEKLIAFTTVLPSSGLMREYITPWERGTDYFGGERLYTPYPPIRPDNAFSWPHAVAVKGTTLGGSLPRGPVTVSPYTLGLVTDPSVNFYHIMLPLDGFLVYLPNNFVDDYTRCVSELAGERSIEVIMAHMYRRAQEEARRRGQSLPDSPSWGSAPAPVPAYTTAPEGTADDWLWDLCRQGLCMDKSVLLALLGLGGAAAYVVMGCGGSSVRLRQ